MAADWLKVVLDRQTAPQQMNAIQEACAKLWQQVGAPATAMMSVTKDVPGTGECALYFSPTMASICYAVLEPYGPTATEEPPPDEVVVLLLRT
jgi:hypothetical protein